MTKRGKVGHRQRLRERFLAGEETSRTEEALLELLLTYVIPQKDVQPLARRLIVEFGSLSAVLAAPSEVLCRVDGIKSNTAALLKLVDWIRVHHPVKETGQSGSAKPSSRKRASLGTPGSQATLFDVPLLDTSPPIVPAKKVTHLKKTAPRRGTEMFTNAVLKEAISLLPELPETESLEEIRKHLRARLHYSAEQTRQRYASYITRRMFPEGYADQPLRRFAKAFRGTQALRDVCFYRFLKAEPLELQVVEEVLLPNLGNGRLSRERIRNYLTRRFPSARSIKGCAQAIVDALAAGGIAKVERTRTIFSSRDIPLPAFAFILHSEYPEPGMYDISKVETNRIIQGMLWDTSRILPSLYELRNRGIISKVSEIDNVRQFTTKWPLERVVEHLVDGGNIR